LVATLDLVARSGGLKSELLEFCRQPRYDAAFRDAFSAHGINVAPASTDQLINVLDYFVLQHRLRNGQTIVEQFVAARRDLPEPEREMLLGWRDVVEGIFEVARHDGSAIVVENLLDELTYRVRSNMGSNVFRPLHPGSFIVARLVPVGEEWLLSGATHPIAERGRDAVHKAAAELAMQQPKLVFRNPGKLDQAWELQRADRDRFVRFFGTDTVVIPGAQFGDRMRDYHAFSRREVLAELSARGRASKYAGRSLPDFDCPSALAESEAVGVVYDQDEGLSFFAGFGEFEEAFSDPSVLGRHQYRQRVLDYLDDDSVSPLPFRRLSERDPDRASEVFRRVLRRRDFNWHRDGEKLLRQRKAWFFDQPLLPRVLPISERLAPYVGRAAS